MPLERLGRIFVPPGGVPFVTSHAALPVAEPLEGGHRIYFSGRDAEGRARIAYFEADLGGTPRVTGVSPRPVLDLGPLGAFDDSGVTSSCLVRHEDRRYLFYTGWSLGVTVPFYLFAGLAVSDRSGEAFTRVSPAPVLPRSPHDPFLTASPWVLRDAGLWRMWYVSGSAWQKDERGLRHYYDIRHAESKDGIKWRPTGDVCVTYANPDEHAFSRPCVVKEGSLYRMWYSFRGKSYRLGYAESPDGLKWQRRDELAVLPPGGDDWDSEMACYPCVVDHEGRRLVLYNGNGYGRTGIGLAALSEEDPAVRDAAVMR